MIYLVTMMAGVLGAVGGWGLAIAAAAAANLGKAQWAGPSGAVTGFVIAIALTLFFKGGFRSARAIATRGLAVTAMTIAIAAAGMNLRSAAFSHLGIGAAPPSVEFEIRLPPPATASANLQRDAQVELHTDRNQTIASIDDQLFATADGRTVLKGKVPLKYQTTDRFVVLSLPGEAQRLFKLRLPAQPSKSDQFGPWHLVDKIAATPEHKTLPNDIYAIRYRVL